MIHVRNGVSWNLVSWNVVTIFLHLFLRFIFIFIFTYLCVFLLIRNELVMLLVDNGRPAYSPSFRTFYFSSFGEELKRKKNFAVLVYL